jgi:hypothetical protein
LYFHSALVTRHFLKNSWTTAGYDPSFMSGYAKSVIFPASSTLPELVVALWTSVPPETAYKVYVLVGAALVPWLLLWGGRIGKCGVKTLGIAVALFLIYVWTDFPISYVSFGMIPYFLAIPLGLAATIQFCRYVADGGLTCWAWSALLLTIAVLVHFTAAMVIVPAVCVSYLTARWESRAPERRWRVWRHVGVWAIPLIVLAVNAFWWWPGIKLATTKGASDFAFKHSDESLAQRLGNIFMVEPPVQSVLWALGVLGLVILIRRNRVLGLTLLAWIGAGFAWGYLAGASQTLDFLQPGRHTYACYTGLALAGGVGLARVLALLRDNPGVRLDLWALVGLALVGLRLWSVPLLAVAEGRLGLPPLSVFGQRISVMPSNRPRPEPFLSSRPSPRLLWVVDRVRRRLKPGERLLYEEGGFSLPGVPDPFEGGRFSGLLPHWTGVEVLGGPYLHAALTTNFTQFGEGKLFGKADWGRDHFVKYAKLYRPAAIVCWSPHARIFCMSNPDLIEVKDDDGVVLLGRVLGFEGSTIEGTAQVTASPGRLRVEGVQAGLDGTVVLRYHSVPCLRSQPPVRWDSVFLAEDPVPFIRLQPVAGTVTFELDLSPGWGASSSR